jgi:hypothetical protein
MHHDMRESGIHCAIIAQRHFRKFACRRPPTNRTKKRTPTTEHIQASVRSGSQALSQVSPPSLRPALDLSLLVLDTESIDRSSITMKTAPLLLLLALGGAAHAEQEMSARSLARERFPSGLKIDRFSTTWPSGASIMADFLEGATAREILRERSSSSSSSTMSAEDRVQLEESTKLLDLLPDLPQSRGSFPTRVEASGIGGAAATGGIMYVSIYIYLYIYSSGGMCAAAWRGACRHAATRDAFLFSPLFFLCDSCPFNGCLHFLRHHTQWFGSPRRWSRSCFHGWRRLGRSKDGQT